MIKRFFRYAAVAAGSMVLGAAVVAQVADNKPESAPPAPVDPNKVVITMGNQKVTAGEFSAFVAALPPDVQQVAQGSGRRNLAEEMIRMRLLAAQARARKLDETPRFRQQMAIMQDNVLVGMLLQDLQPNLATDEEIRKFYEEHKNELERVTARHVLISTMSEKKLTDEEQKAKDAEAKAKAEEIQKRLAANPDDFAKVAEAESQDPGSKEDGGALPPFVRGQMVKEFEDVAFTIEPGKVSDVVKTPFGYHVIRVEKREIPAFDEVKEQIADQVRHDKFEKYFETLKQQANPQLDESFFGPPPKADDKAGAAPAAPAGNQ